MNGLFIIIYLFTYLISISVLLTWKSVHHIHETRKQILGALGLELQMIVSHHARADTGPQVVCKSSQYSLSEPFLQSPWALTVIIVDTRRLGQSDRLDGPSVWPCPLFCGRTRKTMRIDRVRSKIKEGTRGLKGFRYVFEPSQSLGDFNLPLSQTLRAFQFSYPTGSNS